MRPARSLSPSLALIEFDAVREPAPGGVGSPGRFVDDSGRWAWIAVGVCIALLVAIVAGGHDSGANDEQEVAPVAETSAAALGAGRTGVTTLERPAHFTDRRATLSPPTDIGVDVVSAAEVVATIGPLGVEAPELILGHYDDAESGLTLDPAWIVIDRGVITSDLQADGVTHVFHPTNLVRVVNAVTGRVVFTFPAPGEPVMMSE